MMQDPGSPNAQDNLLAQALLQVSGVKPVRYHPVPGIIDLTGGVQEVELDLSHQHLPDLQIDGLIHDRELDADGISFFIHHLSDGRILSVHHLAGAHLPALGRDHLAQVSLGVHEAHCNQGNAQIAAFLEKVSRQKSQASGIKGKGMMQSVLGGEVSYSAAVRCVYIFAEPAGLGIDVVLKAGHHRVVMPQEMGIGCRSLQLLLTHAVEHLDRIVIA